MFVRFIFFCGETGPNRGRRVWLLTRTLANKRVCHVATGARSWLFMLKYSGCAPGHYWEMLLCFLVRKTLRKYFCDASHVTKLARRSSNCEACVRNRRRALLFVVLLFPHHATVLVTVSYGKCFSSCFFTSLFPLGLPSLSFFFPIRTRRQKHAVQKWIERLYTVNMEL